MLFIAKSHDPLQQIGNQESFPFKAAWYEDWQHLDDLDRENADPDIIVVCCDVLDTETISRFEYGHLDNWILKVPDTLTCDTGIANYQLYYILSLLFATKI